MGFLFAGLTHLHVQPTSCASSHTSQVFENSTACETRYGKPKRTSSAQLGHQLIICILYLVLNFVFPVKTNYWKFWDKTFKLLLDGQLSSATQHQVATMWDIFFEIMASNTSNSTVPLRSRCGIWSSGYGYFQLYFDRNTPEIVFTIYKDSITENRPQHQELHSHSCPHLFAISVRVLLRPTQLWTLGILSMRYFLNPQPPAQSPDAQPTEPTGQRSMPCKPNES